MLRWEARDRALSHGLARDRDSLTMGVASIMDTPLARCQTSESLHAELWGIAGPIPGATGQASVDALLITSVLASAPEKHGSHDRDGSCTESDENDPENGGA